MAFWLYSHSNDTYKREQPVKLTGKNGLIASYLQSNAGEDTPFAWQLDKADIIRLIDPQLDPTQHELVIDMLPESFTEVSLLRVTTLRGVSEFDESDMVMACKILQQGRTPCTAETFKASFKRTTIPSSRQSVEAFHLTGGVATGTYYWSKPKMDIGAAICPSAAK